MPQGGEEPQRPRCPVPRRHLRPPAASARELPDAERMLEGLEPLGLTGIACFPGELRLAGSDSRVMLIRPAGTSGARNRDPTRRRRRPRPSLPSARERRDSRLARGARRLRRRGVGASSTIRNNRYDKGARALTANVVLWPRPTTIIMNRAAFDTLGGRPAAGAKGSRSRGDSKPVLTTIQHARAGVAGVGICKRCSRLPSCWPRRPIAPPFAGAVQPVYEELERDSADRGARRGDRRPCAG